MPPNSNWDHQQVYRNIGTHCRYCGAFGSRQQSRPEGGDECRGDETEHSQQSRDMCRWHLDHRRDHQEGVGLVQARALVLAQVLVLVLVQELALVLAQGQELAQVQEQELARAQVLAQVLARVLALVLEQERGEVWAVQEEQMDDQRKH